MVPFASFRRLLKPQFGAGRAFSDGFSRHLGVLPGSRSTATVTVQVMLVDGGMVRALWRDSPGNITLASSYREGAAI
jgi:hypothetical protein